MLVHNTPICSNIWYTCTLSWIDFIEFYRFCNRFLRGFVFAHPSAVKYRWKFRVTSTWRWKWYFLSVYTRPQTDKITSVVVKFIFLTKISRQNLFISMWAPKTNAYEIRTLPLVGEPYRLFQNNLMPVVSRWTDEYRWKISFKTVSFGQSERHTIYGNFLRAQKTKTTSYLQNTIRIGGLRPTRIR